MVNKLRFIKMLDSTFESSSGLTPEFQHFYRVFKNDFDKLLKEEFGAIETTFNRGHFETFGFFRLKNNNVYYFSIGDLRWFKDHMLIRTAKDFKDYTGGSNRNLRLDNEENFISDMRDIIK